MLYSVNCQFPSFLRQRRFVDLSLQQNKYESFVSSDRVTMAKRKPLLGIRLSRKAVVPLPNVSSEEATCDAISVLQQQDLKYSCHSYLNTGVVTDTGDVDTDCREKMIEWCYRVCDCGIFPCDREMVAIAISYLDRYMMNLSSSCGRPTFKLAAVTSFYLATKIMSNMQIKIDSLVDLGRGSFNGDDVLEMEQAILKLLEWRMNPPTIQCYIRQLWTLLPAPIRKTDSIFYRSIFFAELAVYEYKFVTYDRYMIAVACILNAIASQQCDLLVKTTTEIDVFHDYTKLLKDMIECEGLLQSVQSQLWYLYSCSAQVSEDMEKLDVGVVKRKHSCHHGKKAHEDTSASLFPLCHSPVSVQSGSNA